jgi:threonine dehydrogenase-like Zn-dependent dehydrogenase
MLDKRKVVIIGAGHVGSHVAMALCFQGTCDEIVLIDRDREKAVSNSYDVADACLFLPSTTYVRAGDYADCRDGISYTFSMIPSALGKTDEIRVQNLTAMLDGYSGYEAHHININVLDRAVLEDAMEHPENYPQLTIRVSGYAVNFIKLDRPHQLEVIQRTFYEAM